MITLLEQSVLINYKRREIEAKLAALEVKIDSEFIVKPNSGGHIQVYGRTLTIEQAKQVVAAIQAILDAPAIR